MSNQLLELDGYTYARDDLGSYHRVIADDVLDVIGDFYRDHVYVAHKFWGNEILDVSRGHLKRFAQSEMKKAQPRLFLMRKHLECLDFMTNRVLELGCGCGALLFVLRNLGLERVRGWDLSRLAPVVSELLWGTPLRIESREITISLTTERDLDLILALDIIEHVRMDQWLVERIASALAPDGMVIIEVPVIRRHWTGTDLQRYEFLYPERHLHLYTPEGIFRLLERVGLRMIEVWLTRGGKKILAVCKLSTRA